MLATPVKGQQLYPRCLSFVEETENLAIIQAGQTVTVNPRRGSQDKKPWRSLDLASITGQTIEVQHVYDVHLGETVVPYATLDPLKAVLPLRSDDSEIPADENGVGGIRIGGWKDGCASAGRPSAPVGREKQPRQQAKSLGN